jgi:hypothetical protein
MALLSTMQFQKPAEANQPGFYCDTSGRVPVTRIRTSRGEESFIAWNTSTRGYSASRRCREVAARFESQRPRGQLFLTSRRNVNGSPVICYTETRGGSCNRNNVLVTLRRNTNHRAALRRFMDFQRGASNRPLELSGGDSDVSTPLELSGGFEDSPPLELSGSGDRDNISFDGMNHVTEAEGEYYFDLGRAANDLMPTNTNTPTPPVQPPSRSNNNDLPPGYRF